MAVPRVIVPRVIVSVAMSMAVAVRLSTAVPAI
jgi:hypothetical protein